jgi:hypothetical protein
MARINGRKIRYGIQYKTDWRKKRTLIAEKEIKDDVGNIYVNAALPRVSLA